jgi:hypothetical protein
VSTIKSSAENLTLNADGANNDIIFQSNGSNVATLDQAGLLTATTFAGSGASLTALPSAQLTGALPAIDGSSLTGVSSVTQQDPTVLPYADLDSAAHHNVGNFTIDSRGRYRIFVDLRMGGSNQSGYTKVYLGTSSAGGMIGNPRLSIENMNVASWNIGLNFQWVMDFGTSLSYAYTVYVNVYNSSAASTTMFNQSDANGYPVVSCLKVADIATSTGMVAFGS